MTAPVLGLALMGCGGDEEGEATRGTVAPPWDTYCTATFTEDYSIIDVFDDTAFTARAGEKYLLHSLAADRATIFVLTDGGPVDFDVELGSADAPAFTTDCTPEAQTSYLGVFRDTAVYRAYENKTLTDKACDLTAGTVVAGRSTGYALVSELEIGPGAAEMVYRIDLGELGAEKCGGLTEGYVEARDVMVGDTHYDARPIDELIGPGGH